MTVRTPNLFIVGAAKCGTTALYDALGQHPDIFVSPLKEPHYFGEDLDRLNHARFPADKYVELLAGARGERWICEASTSYMHSTSAASELKALSPEARILVMLRNPVEMMHSWHAWLVASGLEQIFDFEEALAAEPDRRAGRRLPRSRAGIRQDLLYRDKATFSSQLTRYFDAFGRDSVRVMLLDDWVADSVAVCRETFDFLGIEPEVPLEFSRVNLNPALRVRSERLHRFLHSPPPRFQKLVQSLLPRDRRARILYAASSRNTRVAHREPMRPALRRALLDEFAPEIERLGRLIGRDLSHWLETRPG